MAKKEKSDNIQNQTMRKRMTFLLVTALAFVITLLAETFLFSGMQMQQHIADKIIRFHVIANSDSEADQELKLAVRDAVGTKMEEKLKRASDLEESRVIVKDSLGDMEEAAARVITDRGYDYEVHASLTTCDFPEKSYGAFTFPAGTYEALELTIGDGEGHNWWCVMYPNLCFQGNLYEVNDAGNALALQETLSGDEYAAVMEDGDYQVRFKILELLRQITE